MKNAATFVKGSTPVYGILGYPVGHSFSPVLQHTIAAALEEEMVYAPFPVLKADLRQAVEGCFALGIRGMNVTVPHKTAVMPFLCGIEPMAEKIGAVNTLKRTENGYFGYNTDFFGLLECFSQRGISIKGEKVLLLGAGGAARAALYLAAQEGAAEICIINRTVEKAQALAEEISGAYPVPCMAAGSGTLPYGFVPDILIQTTSVGMGEGVFASPVADADYYQGAKVALDIIYTPWETKFLKDAKDAGLTAINGFDMLIYQGIASYEIWRGTKIPQRKREEIYQILLSYYRKEGANG